MGLVVELPPASLEAPGLAAAAGDGQAPPADLFAGLLAALEPAPAGGEAPLPAMPPLPKRAPAADAAGLLPALFLAVPLAAAPAPGFPVPAAFTSRTGAGAGEAPALDPLASPPIGLAQAELDPAPLPPAEGVEGALAAGPEAETPAPGPTAEPAATAGDAAAAPAERPALDGSAEANGAEPPGAPAEAPAAEPAAAEGVVRSAGNAPAGLEAPLPPGAAVRAERRPAGERPIPRAAEPAIQHAAPASAVAQLREAPAPGPAAAVAEPAPAAEPQPAAIENLDAVATAVIERVEAGGGEARIHLEPAGLGEITIRLHARHDAVHVDVHAETPEAVQILRDAAADLSSLLGQRGMNLAGLNVGLGTRQGESGGWADQRPRSAAPRDGEFAAILGIEDPAAAARHQRLRAAYNPDGSLLYRV